MNSRILRRVSARLIPLLLGLSVLLPACEDSPRAAQRRAFAAWEQRCKSAGEFIRQTVNDVDGIVVLKERFGNNDQYQFVLDDPYGRDSVGNNYLLNFLRGYYASETSRRIGYRFVEAGDPAHGRAFRYTGRHEEPWQTDKKYLKGYIRFVMDRTPIEAYSARYGVTFDDISTLEDRKLWIAGSSLKVIDLKTGAVMAERVGYMVDPGQGVTGGEGGVPWVRAAGYACPDFNRNTAAPMPGPAAGAQPGQTLDFVQKVLKPSS
jgi:hypothetical protein